MDFWDGIMGKIVYNAGSTESSCCTGAQNYQPRTNKNWVIQYTGGLITSKFHIFNQNCQIGKIMFQKNLFPFSCFSPRACQLIHSPHFLVFLLILLILHKKVRFFSNLTIFTLTFSDSMVSHFFLFFHLISLETENVAFSSAMLGPKISKLYIRCVQFLFSLILFFF